MDSKSQNSDYGSFCNTPSDNFSKITSTSGGGQTNPVAKPDSGGGATGGAAGSTYSAKDETADSNNVQEDSSVMANVKCDG